MGMMNTEVEAFVSKFIPYFLASKKSFSFHERLLVLAISLVYLDEKRKPLF